ncbi:MULTISPECIES: TetR/AcrR family transcriptional regulator [unclassified Isoptericola]|uniref:TetR/AcrR family transcriptional regulator n=1 Tax=unclassified Isoptericola TaxID=2623355 RepID=UPI00271350EF|nr:MULTISPECIES: TetR/AcrR family transcriptional regulator [unclassified Isoptericola]MDO8149017.1 TetR/AcrR family transcriptional regulator [Isoptericola sp. b515]MDO8151043.1 TetR/AcrR family transcriptional regulator [Isoptericola sp. b408]
MPPPPAARAKVLEAFTDLLVTSGERSATLDAVADHAGVSKGGLLYHFGSKDALVDGLVEQLTDLIAADAAAMRADREGPVHYLLRTSSDVGHEFDRAYLAVAELARGAYPRARGALDAAEQAWTDAVVEEVGDPAVARAVVLLSDGIYHRTSLGAAPPPLEELLTLVDSLRRTTTG